MWAVKRARQAVMLGDTPTVAWPSLYVELLHMEEHATHLIGKHPIPAGSIVSEAIQFQIRTILQYVWLQIRTILCVIS